MQALRPCLFTPMFALVFVAGCAARQFATALERNRVNETPAWENLRTGHDFAVTPVNRVERGERECPEFRFRVETAYGEDTRIRTACRQPDGRWEIVS